MFGQQGDETPLFDYCFLKHHDQFLFGNNFAGHQPMLPLPTSLLPALPINPSSPDPDSMSGELGYSSSGCSSYVGSPGSISTSYGTHSPTLIENSFRNSSVREVSSIGDLQGIQQNQWSMSQLASDKSIIESMNRATPYNPKEKKERIERYRSKRNLRNFNKKIQYECRKTLADNRPRVRGRFAKNDEIEKAPQSQWDHRYVDEDDDDAYCWISILDSLSTNDALMFSP